MAVVVVVELGYEFDVKASAKDVFELLADVPRSASFYPKVDQLIDLGGGAYRWETEKIGIAQAHLQTIYASRYVPDAAHGTVVWTPVEGVGNAQVSGNWKITSKKKLTKVVLSVQAQITVPLPALMKMVVAPLVEAEFEKLTEQYIDNLTQQFGGEA